MRDKDELDLLLDSALSTYADPGPDSGLEQRVLSALLAARVPVTPAASPRRRLLLWAIPLPVAACLLLLWYSTPGIQRVPSTLPQQDRHVHPAPIVPEVALAVETRPRAPHATKHVPSAPQPSTQTVASAAFPKLDVFPTPHPLTPQEQAFAVFAVHASEAERKALAEAQQRINAPLSFAAIHIPPVQSPDQGTN